MNPPNPLAFRHSSAQHPHGLNFAFAPTHPDGQSDRAGRRLPWSGSCSHTCYPSPILRSGPSQTGSQIFCNRRGNADCVTETNFPFESLWFAVDSAAIKTPTRGSKKCRNQLSSLPFSPFRFRPACRTRHRAGLPVPQLAPLSRMRWTKTWSQALPLAALPVLPVAASNWACRPASRATDLDRAFGRSTTIQGVARANRPGSPFAFCAPLPGPTKGEPCSRRS
jgi:hypothetical protein